MEDADRRRFCGQVVGDQCRYGGAAQQLFTLKPIDEDLIAQCAEETGGRFVVVEDHLAHGGLATRIADVVTDRGIRLTAFERLGIPQVYAGFGEDEQLRDKHGYGLDATVAAARRVIAEF
ncbi:hypothetical protein Aple_003110 [Acrocarpospora pleiomorpha]|uniref:Transketolase C-terminal domain-containing protein n=1 Tax=Acrocarpospora pleiomorpha TaxID=90975 RepID=A0A5M3X9T3_9ACTN|nr:hypothetical protein Aple_003110 [Acrocarpospora pleiomorpha]